MEQRVQVLRSQLCFQTLRACTVQLPQPESGQEAFPTPMVLPCSAQRRPFSVENASQTIRAGALCLTGLPKGSQQSSLSKEAKKKECSLLAASTQNYVPQGVTHGIEAQREKTFLQSKRPGCKPFAVCQGPRDLGERHHAKHLLN